jgi:thymidylate synthase ThyX
MNVLTLSKLSRALHHASYTFRKKLSHAADSQDQRHRMTPASRPVLAAHLTDEPDYIVPELVARNAAAHNIYRDSMQRTWHAFARLGEMGVPAEHAAYLLPNAVAVRFTESADLVHLHHKLKSRLCYNAQEEIWRASLDEARQIREVEPIIGRYLLPPCGLRQMTAVRPLCPEGDRYCGVPVWKLSLDQYSRVI